MVIAFADFKDLGFLLKRDLHVRPDVIERKIERREIIVLWHDGWRAGFLRYGFFWDEVPFMNMLYIREDLRGRGFGTRLIEFWELEMRKSGYEGVMTSTLSNERAQHLYRRLGYKDCGSLLLPGEPLEILLIKDPA